MSSRRILLTGLVVALAALAWLLARGGGPALPDDRGGPATGQDAPVETLDAEVTPLESGGGARAPADEPEAGAPLLVVEGRVLLGPPDAAGGLEPVPGARIEVGPSSPPTVFHAGEDGRFRVELPDSGHRPVSIMLDVGRGTPWIGWSRRIDFLDGVSAVTDLRALLRRPPRVTGAVTDPEGVPVSGVTVTLGGKPAGVSAEDGTFELDGVKGGDLVWPTRLESEIAADLDGWRALDVDVPGFDEEGRWLPIRVVMVGTATLVVRMESGATGPDGERAGAAGLDLTLDVAPGERFGARENQFIGFSMRADYEDTGDDGTSRFEDVPAGVRLRLRRGDLDYHFVRQEDGGVLRLVGDREARRSDRPLVLTAGEVTEIRGRVDRTIRLVGRVFEADGTPSKEAELVLRLASRDVPGDPPPEDLRPYAIRTDEEGHFDAPCHITGDPEALVIHARSRVGERPSYSPFGGTKYPEEMMIARATIPLATAQDVERHDFRLAAAGSITGRVVDGEGNPLSYVDVRCVHPGTGQLATNALAREASTRSNNSGEFTMRWLPAGSYRLEAASAEHGLASVDGVRPGDTDVEVRLTAGDLARFEVTIRADRPLRTISFARGRLAGAPAVVDRLPLLGADARFTDPLGFPPGAQRVVSGSTGLRSGGLQGQLGVQLLPDGNVTFASAPGVHWMGVRAQDEDGRAYFPVGTGPVRAEAGTYRVELVLVPSASLVGRIEGATDTPLLIRLRAPSGSTVACFGPDGEFADSFRPGADGTFRLSTIPATPLTVEVGTWSELDRGAPRATARIHAEEGEEARVELEVR